MNPSPLAIDELTSPHVGSCHDFDPLMGRWRVRHRRLRDRLAGSTEWDVFEGVSHMQLLLGGQGNVEDNLLDAPQGRYRAAAFRCWDPVSRQWAIWWLDGRFPGELGTPVLGRFEGGDGVFYADETFRGQPIKLRFLWLRTRSDAPRWEQAFSPDGGTTWETNWEMDFSRLP
jgi:hypothetical protein